MHDSHGYLELVLPDGGKQEFELSKSEIALGRSNFIGGKYVFESKADPASRLDGNAGDSKIP